MINYLTTIQYKMEAEYQEKSMLTDLFSENKFWGWMGLLTIFITICVILYFQIRSWEEVDQKQNKI